MALSVQAELLVKVGRVFGESAAQTIYWGLAAEPISVTGDPVDWEIIQSQITFDQASFGMSPPERGIWRES